MSNTSTSKLTREKIQQLLAAVGSGPAEDNTQTEAQEYNWRQPHYFTAEKLTKLNAFMETVAAEMAKRLAGLCHSNFDVTVNQVTQHFADEFLNPTAEEQHNYYYLAFGTDQNQNPQTQKDAPAKPSNQCGLVGTSLETAITLTTQLLGDAETQETSDRPLSELEESLLSDAASAIVNALADSYTNWNFTPDAAVVKAQLPLDLQGTEELCKITFNIKKEDVENSCEVYLLILSERLEPVVTKAAQTAPKFSQKDIANAMQEHLYQMPVSLTAHIGSAMLTFEETISLQINDIVLLDKKVDDSIEIIAEGRTLLKGRPAKSAGNYAIVITNVTQPDT
ncbi:MAG: FliM/FliN family flagellar motor switch protein [Planctomycetota bacterium]|jgi:flagellar motor switch protein FliM